MRHSSPLLWLVGLLVLAGLACAQSGEIVSEEEATRLAQQAIEDRIFSSDSGEPIEGAELQPGDKGELVGSSFIINFFDGPGGQIIAGQERGIIVSVLEVAEDSERFWYKIDAPTGEGWVTENSIEKVEGEIPSEEEDTGPQPGDTVYMAGTGFIIYLLSEPDGLIVAGQERGAAVIVVDKFETEDGELWYRLDAPGGEGWVAAENISVEAPQ